MTGLTRGSAMARPMWFCPVAGCLSLWRHSALRPERRDRRRHPFRRAAVVEVDQATVNQILDVFHKADTAIAAGNLDGVMALYATQYNYHGLKQADIRKIWSDLFEGIP